MSPLALLASRLRSETLIRAAWNTLPHPETMEILAREAFDALVLDMQHGAIDFSAVLRAVPLITGAGKPTIARIPVGEFTTASRLLDAGVAAVIAPMINTLEDARLFAKFAKFPPMGERSWGPHGALTLTGLSAPDYFAQANGLSLSLAMVETRESLAIVEAILGEPGIDGIFLGPADLSIALSNGKQVDPRSPDVERALDYAVRKARDANKIVGVYAPSGERAGELAKKNFHLIAIGSDVEFLRSGARRALAASSDTLGQNTA